MSDHTKPSEMKRDLSTICIKLNKKGCTEEESCIDCIAKTLASKKYRKIWGTEIVIKREEYSALLKAKKLNEVLNKNITKIVNEYHESIKKTEKATAKKILTDLKYNLEASQPMDKNKPRSNDYYNVSYWLEEIIKEFGVEVE